jgi:amino acid transporter
MTTSSQTSKPASPPSHQTLQKISLVPFVALLYGYCAGGPFGFEAMVSTSGPGMALIFMLTVPWLFSIPMALATAEMSTAMPVEGGFYRWVRAAFGDFWGFECGWWNWTGAFLMSGAYGVMLADYVGQTMQIPSRFLHWLIAFAFLALVAYLNVLGIRLVGNLTLVLLLGALVPVAVFTYLGFREGHFNPLVPLMPPGRPWRDVYGVGLALALWIYSGYEQLSTVIEEVEQPERNFPRGLAIVVPLAIVTFILPIAAGLAALGNWQQWQTGYLVTAAKLVRPWLEWPMFAAAAVCTFVLLDSTVLSASRVPFTMAEDGYLHRALARLDARHGTPARAVLVSTGVSALLALFSLTQLIAIYAWLRSATSILTLLALWRLRTHAPDWKPAFRVPGGKIGLLAVVSVPIALFVWAMINSDSAARLWGPAYLAMGLAVYPLIQVRQSSKTLNPSQSGPASHKTTQIG